MSKFKSKKAQNNYANTDSVFIEYLDFARKKEELTVQKAAFIADEVYVPSLLLTKYMFLATLTASWYICMTLHRRK